MKSYKDLLWPITDYENLNVFNAFQLRNTNIDASWKLIDLVMNTLKERVKKVSISPSVFIASNAIIEGPVIIKSGVKIMENVKIIGPAYIGRNVIVGNCALIRESFIGDDSVVGYLVDVARSCIGRSCWFSRVHIADSFLDDEVNVGGGSVFASLRLDHQPVCLKINGQNIPTNKTKLGVIVGKGTQIGANSTIMPGTLIGKNCVIGAGVVVYENIDDDTFCKVNQRLIIRNNIISYSSKKREKFKEILISKQNHS